MRRDEVIKILHTHRDELAQRYGVKRLELFGSVARDEARSASDVDFLVEFDDRPVTLFHLASLRQYLLDLLQVEEIDVVMRDSIFPAIRDNILGEAIHVLGTELDASH